MGDEVCPRGQFQVQKGRRRRREERKAGQSTSVTEKGAPQTGNWRLSKERQTDKSNRSARTRYRVEMSLFPHAHGLRTGTRLSPDQAGHQECSLRLNPGAHKGWGVHHLRTGGESLTDTESRSVQTTFHGRDLDVVYDTVYY